MKTATLCILAALLAGCAKNIDTEEAVKQGILSDIAKKVDVQNMEMNVDSVSFRDKEADAKVSFRPKGADPSQSMTMNYTMERNGDLWRVKSRNMMSHDQQTPPGSGQMPSGSTPMQLPAGHPPTTGAGMGEGAGAQQLPPGHPPVNKKQ